jgi:hypothetical protein
LDAVFTTGIVGVAFVSPELRLIYILQSNVDLISAQYAALDRSLVRSDAYCLNDTECPLHSQGKGSVLEVGSTLSLIVDTVERDTYI